MHASVAAAFRQFSAPLEGVTNFMYLDTKGLVTTGIGNLIDPISYAMNLPWKNGDGSPASKQQIAAEWMAVKQRTDLKMKGGMIYRNITRLRLDDEGVDQLLMGKLQQNESFLVRRFPNFDRWPADAQLATHSMAWACGPAFRFPRLAAALLDEDFEMAAIECHMDERGNAGLIPRNAANKQLYLNAATVKAYGLPIEKLWFPNVADRAVAQDEILTEPDPFKDIEALSGSGEKCKD